MEINIKKKDRCPHDGTETAIGAPGAALKNGLTLRSYLETSHFDFHWTALLHLRPFVHYDSNFTAGLAIGDPFCGYETKKIRSVRSTD
jgi:hypothetical protein